MHGWMYSVDMQHIYTIAEGELFEYAYMAGNDRVLLVVVLAWCALLVGPWLVTCLQMYVQHHCLPPAELLAAVSQFSWSCDSKYTARGKRGTQVQKIAGVREVVSYCRCRLRKGRDMEVELHGCTYHLFSLNLKYPCSPARFAHPKI